MALCLFLDGRTTCHCNMVSLLGFDGGLCTRVAYQISGHTPLTVTVLSCTSQVDVTAPKAVQFFLGQAGSGAPVHFHCDAWNTIAFGSKRWFLTPPSHAIFSKKPIKQWLQHDYPVSMHHNCLST